MFDMGIYCVNAARNLFRAEPEEVFGVQVFGRDPRFREVDETTTAVLRFPEGRIAQFTASQSSADVSEFRIVGTKGDLHVDPAYEYYDELEYHLTVDGKTKVQEFPKSDQFAPELLHFAECILNDSEPEPSGEEGLADVRVLEAICESARSSQPVKLAPFTRTSASRPRARAEKTSGASTEGRARAVSEQVKPPGGPEPRNSWPKARPPAQMRAGRGTGAKHLDFWRSDRPLVPHHRASSSPDWWRFVCMIAF